MTTNSPNPVDGDVQALIELVAAFYPQYGTPGSRDVDITARRKFIDQSAAAIAEAFRELQQEKSRLEDIARHANRGWKHAYETTKRAEAAEAEVQRLNANAQPVSDRCKVPEGWKLVPIEPTDEMLIEGFESEPDEGFSGETEWEKYQSMSGCEQAKHRARLCWCAMLAAAPGGQDD